ncbi:uncharacterized protein LOC120338002 isoform X1 [Styela clava]
MRYCLVNSRCSFLLFLMFISASVFPSILCARSDKDEYDYMEDLEDDITLYWTVDRDEITFQISAPTTGWIGFGFAESGTMVNADVIMMGVKSNREYVLDGYASRNGIPSRDSEQNVEILDWREDDGRTTITFMRELETYDVDDTDIEEGLLRVIWAYGENDIDDKLSFQDYHKGNSGSMRLELIPPDDDDDDRRSEGDDDDDRRNEDDDDDDRRNEDDDDDDEDRKRNRNKNRNNNRSRYEDDDDDDDDEDDRKRNREKNRDRQSRRNRERDRDDDDDEREEYEESPTGKGDEYLDWEDTVYLEWIYDEETISFKLTAPTKGWMGFGISRTKDMTRSDIIIIGVADGQGYTIDAHSSKNGVPEIDKNQDVKLMTAYQNSTHTSISFQRPKKTSDDIEITKGYHNVIWAYGENDLYALPSGKDYHGRKNRGSTRIEFIRNILDWDKKLEQSDDSSYSERSHRGRDDKYADHKSQLFRLNLPLHETLDKEKGVVLQWAYDKTHIIWKLSVPTLGWIGLGLSDRDSMVDADIIMMGVKDDGRPYVLDAHALANEVPKRDQSQQIVLLQATQNDSHTTMIIARARNTRDIDDKPIENREIYVLWASSRFDLDDEPTKADYHFREKGYKKLNFIRPIPEEELVELEPPEEDEDIDRDDDDDDDDNFDDRNRQVNSPKRRSSPRTSTPDRDSDSRKPTSVYLDENERVLLRWNHDGDSIVLAIAAPTQGWVGIGFSPDGTMRNADMIITGVKRSKPYAQDTHATENGPPIVDDTQDVQILHGIENSTYTAIAFKRAHDTFDSDDYIIQGGSINVIWAFGDDDLDDEPDSSFYHSSDRGSKKVVLRPNAPVPESEENDIDDEEADRNQDDNRSSNGSDAPKSSSEYLDHDETIKLEWSLKDESIIFKLSAPTTGWIGLGFSRTRTMKDADLIIVGVARDGEPYVFDTFADENGVPEEDRYQDVKILRSSESRGETVIVFQREIDTMDSYDNKIPEGRLNVLWAYGDDDIGSDIRSSDHHGRNRGIKVMSFIPGENDDFIKDVEPTRTSITTTTNRAVVPTPVTFNEDTTAEPQSNDSDDPIRVFLDDDETFELVWTIEDGNIILQVKAPTLGWIGIAISEDERTTGRDFMIGGTDDGEAYVYDTFDNAGIQTLDKIQDVSLMVSFERGDATTVVFKRSLDTRDDDDQPVREGKMYIVWAYGTKDMVQEDIATFDYAKIGSKQLVLIPGTEDEEPRDISELERIAFATTSFPEDEDEFTESSWREETTTPELTTTTEAPPKFDESPVIYLDNSKEVELQWVIEREVAAFKVVAPTIGWIGVGLSFDGTMKSADMIIAGIDDERQYIYDTHSDINGVPDVDDHFQDAELIEAYEVEDKTTIIFKRKLNTRDLDDNKIRAGEVNIIWAYGKRDIQDKPKRTDYHSNNRGSKILELIPLIEETTLSTTTTRIARTRTTTEQTTTPFDPSVSQLVTLDDAGEVTFLWYLEGRTLVIQIEAPTLGWVGFGFSSDGRKPGSDFIIGGVNGAEEYLFDSHMDESGIPILDESQDPFLLIVSENQTHTTLVVEKSLVSRDISDASIKEQMNIIWAYGEKDISSLSEYKSPTREGMKTIVLLPGYKDPTEGRRTTVATTTEEPYDDVTTAIPEIEEEEQPKPRPQPTVIFFDEAETAVMRWIVDDAITSQIIVPQTDWLGIGFVSRKSIDKVDFIVAGVSYVYDCHIVGNSVQLDKSQNVELIVSNTLNGKTTIVIKRLLQTNDEHDVDIMPGTTDVLWVLGSGDMSDGFDASKINLKMIESIKVKLVPGEDIEDEETTTPKPRATEPITTVPETTLAETTEPTVPTTTTSPTEDTTKAKHRTTVITTTEEPYDDVTTAVLDIEEEEQPKARSQPTVIFFDEAETALMRWIVDDAITSQIIVPQTDWIGIGFVSRKSIDRADFIVAGVSYVYDCHIVGNSVQLDKSQNVELIVSNTLNGKTTIVIKRPLQTKDEHDVDIMPGTTDVLWVLGSGDMSDGFDASKINLKMMESIKVKLVPGEDIEEETTPQPRVSEPITTVSETTLAETTESTFPTTTTSPTEDTTKTVGQVIIPPTSQATVQYTDTVDIVITDVPTEKPTPTHFVNTAPWTEESLQDTTNSVEQDEDSDATLVFLNEDVSLQWSINGNNIVMQVVAPTLGWVGIGFSKDGTMTGADMMIGGIDNGSQYVYDTFAEVNGVPKVDAFEDVVLLVAYENSTHTTLVFSRSLNTEDPEDAIIKGGMTNVIWAFGKNDMTDIPRRTDYHFENKGSKLIKLYPDQIEHVDSKKEIKTGRSESTIQAANTLESTQQLFRLKPVPPKSVSLDNGTVHLQWSADENEIIMQVVAPTLGWVGFGFSMDESMKGADLILAGIIAGETEYIYDTHADENGIPEIDKHQDGILLVAYENATHTTIAVKRNLTAYDTEDISIKEGEMYVIWAYSDHDLTKVPTLPDYKFKRSGSKAVELCPKSEHDDSNTTANSADGTLVTQTAKMHGKIIILPRGLLRPPSSPSTQLPSYANISSLEINKTSVETKNVTQIPNIKSVDRGLNNSTASGQYRAISSTPASHGTFNSTPTIHKMQSLNIDTTTTNTKENSSISQSYVKQKQNVFTKVFELPNMMWLDKNRTVSLKWITDKKNLILQMSAPTTGWIGIGFSSYGTMAKSDMVVTGVSKNKVYAMDTNARRNGVPRLDESQDVNALFFSQNETHTTVMIQRKTNTGDRSDTVITDGDMHVIWAYGNSDIKNSPRKSHYHGKNKGSMTINFLVDPKSGSSIDYKGFVALSAAVALAVILYSKVKR